MGRRKISIKAIDNKKIKYSTFNKRKNGLIKKAAELSMLCDVKMLLVFEDLNGDVVRYSTHGVYEPKDYFQQTWKLCERSFTAKDYPSFFKVKKYKKVIERLEKKMKTEGANLDSSESSEASEQEDESDPLKESKTLKEKINQKLKAVKASANGNTSHKESGKSAEADVFKNTLSNTPNSNIDVTYRDLEKFKAEDGKNFSRSSLPLDLPERLNLNEKPLAGFPNLMGPEFLDMRSPGINYLNLKEHFTKPSTVAQRLNQPRDDFSAPLHMNQNSSLNEGHDGFSNQINQKGSYENYLQYLDDANNFWRTIDAANGFKMMPSYLPMMNPSYLQMMTPSHGIGNLLGFGGGGYPQTDPSFMLDDSLIDSMRHDPLQAELGDHNGIEPSKKIKKE